MCYYIFFSFFKIPEQMERESLFSKLNYHRSISSRMQELEI